MSVARLHSLLCPSLALVVGLAPLSAAARPAARQVTCKPSGPSKAEERAQKADEEARRAEEQRRAEGLAAASAERAAITERAAALVAAEGPAASARWLSGQAQVTADPRVHLMAAETWLSVHGPEDRELERAAQHAQDAVALADPAVAQLRIAGDEVDAIRSQSAGILRAVERRREGARQARRGKQELIAGSILLGVAALGGGLMAGGAGLQRREDEGPGSAMLAAGAVLAVGGAILGVTLTSIGARELRQGRRLRGQRAELRVAPTLGGLSLSGRF